MPAKGSYGPSARSRAGVRIPGHCWAARTALLAVAAVLWLPAATAQGGADFFEARVRPLLAEKCFACHTQTRMGGLEMVSREALLRGGQSGPAVEPRAPERSLLIRAVRYDHERLRMPPTERLTDEEVAVLTKWVDDGAVWPDSAQVAAETDDGGFAITDQHWAFWSFRPVERSGLPLGQGAPIDRFVNAALREAGIARAPRADRRTLARRVFYDLLGLPPSPDEMEELLAAESPDAFATLVDRLLASPRYGERWGRHWLDVARYSDDRLNSTQDEAYPNAWRYRDWVIQAFNDDMPFDLFVKAQMAADQLSLEEMGAWSREDLIPGLGMFGLSPKFQDDRIDVTGRGFLALTIGCAQCHDHKFDPIPTEDYYALLGVFNSSEVREYPLAPDAVVKSYREGKERLEQAEQRLEAFLETQSEQLVDALAARTAVYVLAAWQVAGPAGATVAEAAAENGLDEETLQRWFAYLEGWPKQHPLLDRWKQLVSDAGPAAGIEDFAAGIQAKVLALIAEKKRIDRENDIRLRGDHSGRNIRRTALLALPRDDFYLWNDVASPNSRDLPAPAKSGILYYRGAALERFLSGVWQEHVSRARREVERLEADLPPKYPYLHALADKSTVANEHVHIRGSADNLGDEVPRRFLRILSSGEPAVFKAGSGRLDLARAIASPGNPLTARVIVNRVWLHHFGRGIVGTPSNFGMMGERPSHPRLLDYLAARFMDGGWSIKALHREILLTEAYQRAAADIPASRAADPENRLLWRANRRRLDAESMLDSMLYLAGRLHLEAGGPPRQWDEETKQPRTVYGFVSRRRLDVRLGLFDFPNPNRTSPRRFGTNTPLQGLFFLNSPLLMEQASALAERLSAEAGPDDARRIRRGYRLVFGRLPTEAELALNREFVAGSQDAWPRLVQAWFSSNEFRYVN